MSTTVEKSVGVTAAGISTAPTPWYGAVSGNYLDTHGIISLSWAEWIKVLGAIYILVLLIKMLHGKHKEYRVKKQKKASK